MTFEPQKSASASTATENSHSEPERLPSALEYKIKEFCRGMAAPAYIQGTVVRGLLEISRGGIKGFSQSETWFDTVSTEIAGEISKILVSHPRKPGLRVVVANRFRQIGTGNSETLSTGAELKAWNGYDREKIDQEIAMEARRSDRERVFLYLATTIRKASW